MAHTIYVGKIAKRKNSTLQPTLNTSFDVLLKSPTSLHTPTFTISAASFDYNYIKWGDRYYFVTDVVSKNNNLWEVSAICDVLATYKTDILASTQFVSYSSQSGGTWLADTRIPVLKSATVAQKTTTMNFLFTSGGFYVLSAIGEQGCRTYGLDITQINNLLQNVNYWKQQNELAANGPVRAPHSNSVTSTDFPMTDNDISTLGVCISRSLAATADAIGASMENLLRALNDCLASLAYSAVQTGILGNAYLDAVNCIKSCIWVPFFMADFVSGAGGNTIHLGNYDTGVPATPCQATPVTRPASVDIPWQFNDWRRCVCEEIYLYLPMVGMIALPSDELVNETQITVEWSATATDGCIAYLVKAGNQIIGTFGANCSANYPIGFSQQASAGEVFQSLLGGVEQTTSTAIEAGSSLNPMAWIAGAAGVGMGAFNTTYNAINTKMSRHNSCIGGIGGGAGSGLSLDMTCYSVAHDTIVTPATMKDTMGLPTMKPMSLSTLTGYCQCANAHIAATGAEAQEIDELDAYLNSGFYIE